MKDYDPIMTPYQNEKSIDEQVNIEEFDNVQVIKPTTF